MHRAMNEPLPLEWLNRQVRLPNQKNFRGVLAVASATADHKDGGTFEFPVLILNDGTWVSPSQVAVWRGDGHYVRVARSQS